MLVIFCDFLTIGVVHSRFFQTKNLASGWLLLFIYSENIQTI